MRNLLIRSISGLVYALLIILGCYQSEYSPLILMLIFGVLGLYEWQKMKTDNFSGRWYVVSLIAFLSFIIYFSDLIDFSDGVQLLMMVLMLISLVLLVLGQSLSANKDSISSLTHNLFGLVYLSLPLLYAVKIPMVDGNNRPWLLVSVFILIWSSDSFAYLVGRFFGRNKLFERISPKKTWEGFFGGVFFTVLIAYLLFYFSGLLSLTTWIGLAIIASSIGTLGDLFESAVKRHFKIKDSGNLIPGHGGILDRIDSLLFVAPCSYLYLELTQHFNL